MRRTVLVLGVASWILAADAAPPVEDDAAAGARQRRAIQDLLAERKAQETTRGFTFKVVDQRGEAVAGVPIYTQSYRTLATPTAIGGLTSLDARTVRTGDDGMARVPPATLEWMSADVQLSQLPMPYDQSDRPADIHDEHFVFGSQAPPGYRPDPGRTAAGIDYVFHVWRYRGPHPLLSWNAKYQPLPEDGSAVPWNATDIRLRIPYDGKSMAEAVVHPDFRVRFWVDPQQELMIGTPGAGVQANPDLRWWAEVECIRGGFSAPTTDGGGMMEAPAVGYVDRISWGSVPGPPGSVLCGAWNGAWPSAWCYWRLPGSPPRYGLAHFIPAVVPAYGDRPRAARMEASFWFNPAPGDRLLERPMRRILPERGAWITGLTDADSLHWGGGEDAPSASSDPIGHIAPRETP